MGLLADVFSYGDGLKRRLGGLLSDPAGTIDLGARRFNEDQQALQGQAQDAGFLPGSRSVLQTPQDRKQAQAQFADKALEAYGGLLGVTKAAPDMSYRGGHTAPMKDRGAPLHDLTKIYPDDIYSPKAAQYYGHYGGGSMADARAVAQMQMAKGRPNMPVTMYRAVPHEPSVVKQIEAIDKQMAAFLRRGTVPKDSYLKGSAWYENAARQKEKLVAMADQQVTAPIGINNGDWVTLSREYAKEHGESALNGKYKIVSKKVPARKLFTDGNSIQEFGYDESGKALVGLLGAIGAGTAGGLYLNEQQQMKLNTTPRIDADPAVMRELRAHAQQVNAMSEGRLVGAYNALTAAPTTGTFAVGDFIRNSAPAEAGSASSKYVIFGWVCVTAGTPGTWVQCRFLTGN